MNNLSEETGKIKRHVICACGATKECNNDVGPVKASGYLAAL